MKHDWSWAKGTILRANTDANALGRLVEKHGRLVPEQVVEFARPKRSELHPEFEWDDAVAAEAHRRQRARELLNHLKVTVNPASGQKTKASKALVSVSNGMGGKCYRPVYDVVQEPETWQEVLDEIRRQIDAWNKQYSELEELRPILEKLAAVVA